MTDVEKFQHFESTYDLKKFTIDGLWYYPVVKMAVYFELAGRKGGGVGVRSGSAAGKIWRQFLWSLKWRFKSAALHPVKYLFADNALTRRQTSNGSFENIYISALQKAFAKDGQLLIEYPAPDFGHYAAVEKEHVYFPDWEIFKIFLKARIKKKKWPDQAACLKDLYQRFGLSYDAAFINDRLNKMFVFIKFFRRFLQKVRPQIILLIDGYDYKQMALIYAAKELGIPTVELQHGMIDEAHIAYMYAQVADRSLFADYLFTFGQYFSDLIKQHSVVWPERRVIPVGFPYMEAVKERPPQLPERLLDFCRRFQIIYVTSQWTVRDKLKDFILQLSAKVDDAYMIFYKIHPGEKDAQKFYESFGQAKNIALITDKTINSMEIMKVAAVHSTVYSTSYFESVFFELPNIFIEVPGYSKTIEKFVDGETTFLAGSVDEYVNHLAAIKADASFTEKLNKRRSIFYESDALNMMSAAVNEIVDSNQNVE